LPLTNKSIIKMGQTGSKENPYKVPDHQLNFPQPIRHYHSLSNDR